MDHRFPDGFQVGAATASHQVEGNNVNNDWWEREQALGLERSGDACDSYHRYEEDVDLLARSGLNAYRFSLEWSRIEPDEGEFSHAALDHYRRMVEACLTRGVEPVVTLNHFTVPRWFEHRGGWLAEGALDLFERFVERSLPVIREGVEWVCTLNEPNLTACLASIAKGVPPEPFPPRADEPIADALLAAHGRARTVLRQLSGVKSGFTVASFDFHETPETDEAARRMAYAAQDRFFEAAADDDFIGVQAYSRIHLGAGGPLPTPAGAETTQTGWEYYPPALGEMVTRAHELSRGTTILVTENGIATDDDARRIDYITGALRGLAQAMAAGADVRGYLHWSLLDNFEWFAGYQPTFGLIAVDRETFTRTPKPSLSWLGEVARRNGLPAEQA